MVSSKSTSNRASTGIETLDKILRGGLPPGEMYVVNGAPGTGKTTLALHFLQAGAANQEKVLCLALSQRVNSLEDSAKSVGLKTSGITFQDLSTVESLQALSEQQTIFDTSEVELADTVTAMIEIMEQEQPNRVVFDGIAYLRLLARDSLIYRQQVFKLRDYISPREITLMLTDTQDLAPGDNELNAMAHGVIDLSMETTRHGSDHRYLRIAKLRGSGFEPGKHDMEISDRGIRIYRSHLDTSVEAISAETIAEQANADSARIISSGLPSLDKLVGGGLITGTSCLLVGPSGTGKTSMTTLFAHNFATQGGKVSIFLFDELADTFDRRSKGLGMDVAELVGKDRIRIRELSFGDVTPGKFASLVDHDVDIWGAGIVIIDTLTGYWNSMPTDARLTSQMHELMMSLNRRGVLTFLVVAQRGVIGPALEETVDISYLADTVLLLRHFEDSGVIRQAVSVYKKRYGDHEKQIREVRLRPGSIQIGQSLSQFSGILSRTPQYTGEGKDLLRDDD
ncbi:MAG: circadian clock protein KaiC [Leptolyngbya foveolarum]|uniref:Circadian clock protein KaiC n=1 Tax=Leptolyngbya foveolarum TaxID=47253 RepID=A0A2W4WLL0_9CYAN|nr:MAG: circadian clock protein KaiC [Leptolyngbya foveolarum]